MKLLLDMVGRSADGMEALAKRLLRLAALCRRIDAECRAPEVVVERQAARDVTLTWQPGPGAPLGVQRVVPGDSSTYPAEGEPVEERDYLSQLDDAALAEMKRPAGSYAGLRKSLGLGEGEPMPPHDTEGA